MPVSLAIEAAMWAAGARVIVGMDEVGRGALAGPVSVGAVALCRCDAWPTGLADSKELSPARREQVAALLADFGLARAIGSASSAEVDARGIIGALRLAGWRALESIVEEGVEPDVILLDGSHDWLTPPPATLPLEALLSGPSTGPRIPPVTTVVKGDATCVSIAAASVLAKVARDAVMALAHNEHPDYGWRENKGYGSASHIDALVRLGPTPRHRTSWNLPGCASPVGSPGRMMDA
jgi:ribonuclease HII